MTDEHVAHEGVAETRIHDVAQEVAKDGVRAIYDTFVAGFPQWTEEERHARIPSMLLGLEIGVHIAMDQPDTANAVAYMMHMVLDTGNEAHEAAHSIFDALKQAREPYRADLGEAMAYIVALESPAKDHDDA